MKAQRRRPTQREHEIHDAYMNTMKARASRLKPFDIDGLAKIADDFERMQRRYGWSGSGNDLWIDENIVWNDIQKANPVPDILDTAPPALKRKLAEQAQQIIEKAATV